MKRVIALILCLLTALSLVSLSGCTMGQEKVTKAFDTEKESCSPENWTLAKNDKYTLLYDEATNTLEGKAFQDKIIQLVDNATGESWSFTAGGGEDIEAVDPVTGMPLPRMPEPASALVVEYLDSENNQRAETTSYIDANKNGRVCATNIENGVRFEYYFDYYEIMIPVSFTLREDSVAVSFNPAEIQEGSRYKAVSVRIAPFWCSVQNDSEDSYLFHPSGSGAIIEPETLAQGVTYSAPVFGRDYVMLKENEETETEDIKIPVFGAKVGNIATCAIIEQGQGASYIGAKVGYAAMKYSSVFATYQIRGYTENRTERMNNATVREAVFANYLNPETFVMGFYPLQGDKANYTGMAEAYKNYLKKNGAIAEKQADSPLNVTFIGGVMVSESFLGVPYKNLTAATTFKEAQTILSDISANTDTKLSAKLLGFGSTGIDMGSYAGGLKFHKNFGSKKDLANLSTYCGENGIDLYYDFDIVKLKGDSAGYSTFFDVAYNAVEKIATVYDFDAATRGYYSDRAYNLLTREKLMDGAKKVLKAVNKWEVPGVSLETLTYMAYSDYSTGDSRYYGRGNMAQDVNEIAHLFHEADYKVAGYAANAYAALASDIVFDTPSNSSKELIFSYDVPFYQMVFKGYIPLTGTSINMAANADTHLLKMVESGSGLHYTVINTYDNDFINYQGYYFFGSEYSSIKDNIKDTYATLKDYYEAVDGEEITSHTVLANGLRETVFSNGTKVYVNYTEADLTAPSGDTVEAESFILK